MKILFLGDVVGEIGLRALSLLLPSFRKKDGISFVVVNGENATLGKGLRHKDYEALLSYGADCVTLGNHYAARHETNRYIGYADRLVRPINVDFSGEGSRLFSVNGKGIRVTSVLGRSFMKEPSSGYRDIVDSLLLHSGDHIHIVDFHGESTSEKSLFAHYVDGRVSAVIGTHTHILTDDAKILPKGTAFLTDAGSAGLGDSVIGFEAESALEKIYFGSKAPFVAPKKGKAVMTGAVLEFANGSNFPISIKTIKEYVDVA